MARRLTTDEAERWKKTKDLWAADSKVQIAEWPERAKREMIDRCHLAIRWENHADRPIYEIVGDGTKMAIQILSVYDDRLRVALYHAFIDKWKAQNLRLKPIVKYCYADGGEIKGWGQY